MSLALAMSLKLQVEVVDEIAEIACRHTRDPGGGDCAATDRLPDIVAADGERARRLFDPCAALDASVPHCPSGRGRVAEKAGDWAEALAAHEEALARAVAVGYPDLARFREAVTRAQSRTSGRSPSEP